MRVDPITELKDIKNIKRLLDDNPRNKIIFVMGVNSGLRVQDLLQLRIGDVKNAEIADRVILREVLRGFPWVIGLRPVWDRGPSHRRKSRWRS